MSPCPWLNAWDPKSIIPSCRHNDGSVSVEIFHQHPNKTTVTPVLVFPPLLSILRTHRCNYHSGARCRLCLAARSEVHRELESRKLLKPLEDAAECLPWKQASNHCLTCFYGTNIADRLDRWLQRQRIVEFLSMREHFHGCPWGRSSNSVKMFR